jgi:predicted transcriptional regulator
MNTQTESFIEQFNKLEAALKIKLKKDRHVPYGILINEAAIHDDFIRRHKSLLDSFGDLRNVLVHKEGNEIIAIPSIEAVKALTRIVDKYTAPVLIYDCCHHEVITTSAENTLAEAMNLIKKHNYSKIPVYKKQVYVGLLSGNIIARWLAAHIDKDETIKALAQSVTLEDVLAFAEKTDQVRFIPRNMNVYEFIKMSKQNLSKAGVYLMTQNGKPTEKPLGILTNYDFPSILKELEL